MVSRQRTAATPCSLARRSTEEKLARRRDAPRAVAPLHQVHIELQLAMLGQGMGQLVSEEILPQLPPRGPTGGQKEVASQLLGDPASPAGEISPDDSVEHRPLIGPVERSVLEESDVLGGERGGAPSAVRCRMYAVTVGTESPSATTILRWLRHVHARSMPTRMPSRTTAMAAFETHRRKVAPNPRRNRITFGPLVVALVAVLGCAREDFLIPAADGPLVLEVRYPTLEPVAVTDSIAVWGTIGTGQGRLRLNGRSVPVEPNGGFATFVPMPTGEKPTLALEARKGSAVVRRSIPITRARPEPAPPVTPTRVTRWVRLNRSPSDTVDAATQARPIYARWTPGGAIALPIQQGIRLPVEAETPDAVRLRLARGVAVWVPRAEAEEVAPRRATPIVANPRLAQTADRSVVEIALPEALATTVETVQAQIRWILFGARAAVVPPVGANRGLVRRLTVRDANDGRVVVDVVLASPPLGWRTSWRDGKAVLEIRPRPTRRTLTGLVVALDPGHPPTGSIGPTGLTEDSLTLAVALEAAARLRALGARPFLTRHDPKPVSLEARTARAEAANAELFVSIHANAPGDGRPPWSVDGTRVYWLSPHALSLAKLLEDSVAAATRQDAAGVIQLDLAVLRPTWYPAVLVEGTALVMPLREAYLRSSAGIADYAAGLVAGIRSWVENPQLTGR